MSNSQIISTYLTRSQQATMLTYDLLYLVELCLRLVLGQHHPGPQALAVALSLAVLLVAVGLKCCVVGICRRGSESKKANFTCVSSCQLATLTSPSGRTSWCPPSGTGWRGRCTSRWEETGGGAAGRGRAADLGGHAERGGVGHSNY